MKFLILILTCLLLFSSCKENDKERMMRLVNEWQGKEIRFPENPVFTRFATDTVGFQIPPSEYKILVYVDSIGCTSCKLQLPKWKEFMVHLDTVAGGKVPFLFFFQSKDEKELGYLLKRDRFDVPVYLDNDNRFNDLNRFPSDMAFQTFLLDKDNRVVVLGNPVHNLSIKELYLKQITGKSSPESKMIRTTAEAVKSEIDFGSFPKSEVKKAIFEIKNTGNVPLVLVDVSTTCGCTAAAYDKEPANPGDILRVELTMTPKDTGFFDEVATIKCNTASPVKVRIRGHVQ